MSIRTNVATQRLLLRTNSYVELGSGLNVRDAAGRFAPADPSFRVTMNGAEAHGTEHKVIVPADIWLGESIKVVQPGGESLAFQPLGIDYYDPSDGRSVLLDAVTNAGR